MLPPRVLRANRCYRLREITELACRRGPAVREPLAETFTRSLVMGKGNKVRKKEVKKPKQDKKAAVKK